MLIHLLRTDMFWLSSTYPNLHLPHPTFQEEPWVAEDPKQSAKNRCSQYLKYLKMAGKGMRFVFLTEENKIIQNIMFLHWLIL